MIREMQEVERKFWVVHIYKQGLFNRAVDVTFTEVTAEIFCKSFNRAQTIFKAVAKEVVTLVEVEEQLSVTEERD